MKMPHNCSQSVGCGVFTEQAELLPTISNVQFRPIPTSHLLHWLRKFVIPNSMQLLTAQQGRDVSMNLLQLTNSSTGFPLIMMIQNCYAACTMKKRFSAFAFAVIEVNMKC